MPIVWRLHAAFTRTNFNPILARMNFDQTLRQFIDRLDHYAKRKEPMRLKATITYRDREGKRYEDKVAHDLRIYLDLGQILNRN